MDSRMTGCFSSHRVSPVVVFFQPHGRGDIARVDGFDILAVIGVHLQDTAHPLVIVLVRVIDRGAGIDRAGIDPEKAQLAHKGIGRDLERESRERLSVGRMPLDLLTRLGIDALDGGGTSIGAGI